MGPNQGIAHQLIADHGYALPGTVLLCSDSHTCSAGVFNCVARGVGAPDVVYAAIKGETWFRVGETIRYELEGSLAPAVTMKDAFFQIASRYGEHATMNVELGGPGMADLGIGARKTLTTMAAELSAEFATFEPDDVMLEWVRARNPAPFEAVLSGQGCALQGGAQARTCQYLSPWSPFRTASSDNSRPVADAAGTAIDQAFVGSCANGTLEDLALVAQVLEGRQVSPKVRFLVTPASQNVYREALRTGIIAKLVRCRRTGNALDVRRLRRRAYGRRGAERNVHHRNDAQFQGAHGRPYGAHLHGLSGDCRSIGDHGCHYRPARVPKLRSER